MPEDKFFQAEVQINGNGREKFRVRSRCLHAAAQKALRRVFRRLPRENEIYLAKNLHISIEQLES